MDGGAVECVHALAAAGFETEAVGEVFRIRFDLAQRLLRRAWTPSGYRLERADRVDEAGLFTLDNALRNLVPGTDGWTGDRAAFREELTSPEFDAGAYLVAVEEASHDLVGLVRIWRNATGPRLGLVGVLHAHRGQPVAAALLKEALLTAATWGFDEVVSETSPDNTHTYPRLRRMGATPIGSFMQMVRQTRHADA